MEGRGRYETELEATELSLAPPGTASHPKQSGKRALPDEPTTSQAPPAKTLVVGWPPVRSFRRNNFQLPKKTELFVKVSMDGAAYLRKIDVNVYKGYAELRRALDDMFKCFSTGPECAVAYEDKDGDWMLAGDVPWEMFRTSCKRLRIMKGNDAKGLGL